MKSSRNIAFFLAVAIILSVVPIFPIQADATQAKLTYIKGDVNFDRVLDKKDIQDYVDIVTGKSAVPTGTTEFNRIAIVNDGSITMEDVRRVARVVAGKTQAKTLYKSDAEITTYVNKFFTDLSNEIKSAGNELKDDYLEDYFNTATNGGEITSSYIKSYYSILTNVITAAAVNDKPQYLSIYYNKAIKSNQKPALLNDYYNLLNSVISSSATDKKIFYLTYLYDVVKSAGGEQKNTYAKSYFSLLREIINSVAPANRLEYLKRYFSDVTDNVINNRSAYYQEFFTSYCAFINEQTTADKTTYVNDFSDRIITACETLTTTEKQANIKNFCKPVIAVISSVNKDTKDSFLASIYNKFSNRDSIYMDAYVYIFSEVIKAVGLQTSEKLAYLDKFYEFAIGHHSYADEYLDTYAKVTLAMGGDVKKDLISAFKSKKTEIEKTATAEEKKAYDLCYFNLLANNIKTSEFKSINKLSYFIRTTSTTATDNFEYKGLLFLMKDKISEEYKQMDGTTVEYSRLIEDSAISNNGMPCFDKEYVSALNPEDIASINIENGAAVDILKGYGDSYLREANNKVYDITRFKAPVSNTIKVTVTLKQENKDGVLKLPSAENGGTTALMRGYGTDVRNIIQEGTFNKTEPVVAGITMNMDMKCVNLKSDCKIVYFFDANTLAPVAAGYTVGIVSDQSVTVEVNLSEGEYKNSNNSFHFEPTSTSIYDYYYFFSNAYPIAG